MRALLLSLLIPFSTLFAVSLYAESGHDDVSSHEEHQHEHHHEDKHKDEHDDMTASLPAHAHGQANLDIIAEGQLLEIILESPALNLVGFEHQVETPLEQQRLEKSKQTLMTVEQVFEFKGTVCQAKKIETDFSAIEAPANNKHLKKVHSDIMVQYQFHCQNLAKLNSLSLKLLAAFPAIKKLQVRWIINGKQGLENMTQASPLLSLN